MKKQDYEFFMRGAYSIEGRSLMESHYDADSFVEDNLSLLKINITSAILEYLVKENITSAAVSGIGATKLAELGLYNIETKEYKKTTYTGLYEVGSFIGNITQKDGEPYLHIHITIGDPEKNEVHCGHLNKAVIGATSEIFITVFDEKIGRQLDEKTGINIFEFEK